MMNQGKQIACAASGPEPGLAIAAAAAGAVIARRPHLLVPVGTGRPLAAQAVFLALIFIPCICFSAEPAVDLSKVADVFKLVGRTDADAKDMQGVFRDPADGVATLPVGVRIKAVDGHPPTYVLGVAVKLAIDESGDVRERHWSIEPPVTDFICSEKKTRLWWVSPSPGEYTVTVTVVGRQSGIATDRIKITLVTQLDQAGKPVSEPPPAFDGSEKPTDVVKRALAKVDQAARDAELLHVQQVFAKSNTLSEARAYLLGANSLGPEKLAAWQPLLSELDKLFDALRKQERMPTAGHERGAIQEVAKALQE